MVDVAGGRRGRLDVRHVGVRMETREEDAEAQERRERFIFQKKIGFLKGKTKYNIIYYVLFYVGIPIVYNRHREKCNRKK